MAGSRLTQAAIEVLRTSSHGVRLSQTAAEILRSTPKGARVSQDAIEVLRSNTLGLRVTQTAAEVLRSMSLGARVSQNAVEVLRSVSRGARVSQDAVEVLRSVSRGAHLTQAAVEVLRPYSVGLRSTQAAVEVLRTRPTYARATQALAEVLRLTRYDARVTQTLVEVLQTGHYNARVSSLFVEVLRENQAAQPQPTLDAEPWPFPPDGNYDIVERYGYASDVLRTRAGHEQRRLLRSTANGQVSFTNTLTTVRELDYAQSLASSFIGRTVYVPLWCYQQRLQTDLEAGTSTVPATTGDIPLNENGIMLLWKDPWTWELFRIDSIEFGELTTLAPLTSPWDANRTHLIPCVAGYMQEREELARHDLAAGNVKVEFDVETYISGLEDDPLFERDVIEYYSHEILTEIPHRPGPIPEGITRAFDELDPITGLRWMDVLEVAAVGDRAMHWPCFSRVDALVQRQWLDARKGLTRPVWIPTHEPDLELSADANAGASSISILPIDYSGFLWPGSNRRRHLAIYAKGAEPSYHYVTSANDPGDGSPEVLELDPPLPVDWPATTTKISFLRFCRLREPYVDRVWRGTSYCATVIPYVEIPQEAPGGI